MATATKVTPATESTGPDKPETDKKKGPKPKATFDWASGTNAQGQSVVKIVDDGEGNKVPKLIGVPTAFDPTAHKPIPKENFEGDEVYIDYRVHCLEFIGNKKLQQASKLKKRAERIRKFGDKETRGKAMKIARMREQLAALETEMSDEGFDMTLLDENGDSE